jgi:hypothetical protein
VAGKQNIISTLAECSQSEWNSAGMWLTFTVALGCIPFFIGALAVWVLSSQNIVWADFIRHGELAIYSAGLIAASTRLIAKDVNSLPFVHRQFFTLLSILFVIATISLYSIIKAAVFVQQPRLNDGFIITFSLILVVCSIVFSFFIFLLDVHRVSFNPRAIADSQQDDLARDFKRLP